MKTVLLPQLMPVFKSEILSPNVNVMTIIFIFMSDCVLLLFVGIWLSNISSQLVFFFAFLFESGYF